MKQVTEVINLESFRQSKELERLAMSDSQQRKQSTQSTQLSPTNAVSVWEAFSQIFGQTFVNQWGEIPNDIWIEELAALSAQDVEIGIEASKRSGSDFAPSLPKFLAYCVKDSGDTPEHKAFKAQCEAMAKNRGLPKPSNPDIRKAEIAKMKQL